MCRVLGRIAALFNGVSHLFSVCVSVLVGPVGGRAAAGSATWEEERPV